MRGHAGDIAEHDASVEIAVAAKGSLTVAI